MVAACVHGTSRSYGSGCPGPPKGGMVATNKMLRPLEMSPKTKHHSSTMEKSVAAVPPNQPSLTSRTNAKFTGGSNDTTAANTTSAGIDLDLKSAPAPPSPVPSPKLRPPPPPRPGRSPAKEERWLSTRLRYEWRLLQKHSPRRPKLSPTLSPQLQTSDSTVAGSPHFLPEGSKATDSSLTPDPARLAREHCGGTAPFSQGVRGCQGRRPTGQGGGPTRLRKRRHREHQRRSRRPRMWTQRSTSNCPRGGLQSSKHR